MERLADSDPHDVMNQSRSDASFHLLLRASGCLMRLCALSRRVWCLHKIAGSELLDQRSNKRPLLSLLQQLGLGMARGPNDEPQAANQQENEEDS